MPLDSMSYSNSKNGTSPLIIYTIKESCSLHGTTPEQILSNFLFNTETIQLIAIFLGSVSGVDLGKLIVKTPFTMDALMSSF